MILSKKPLGTATVAVVSAWFLCWPEPTAGTAIMSSNMMYLFMYPDTMNITRINNIWLLLIFCQHHYPLIL